VLLVTGSADVPGWSAELRADEAFALSFVDLEGVADRLSTTVVDCVVGDREHLEDGLELFDAVREGAPDTPVVLFDGHGVVATRNVDRLRWRDENSVGVDDVVHALADGNRREPERRSYETVVHALGGPAFVTDAEGYLTLVNPTFEALTGYDAEAVLDESMHFSELFRDGDRDRIRNLVGSLRSGDRVRATIGATLETRDGRALPVENSLSVLPGQGARSVVGTIRDVSDRRQQRQRLEVLNRILRHNVRNQMNVVSGSAETIVEMADDPTIAELARRIVDAAGEMTTVSDNVRGLQAAIDRENDGTVDLVQVVEETIADARERYPDAAIVTDFPGRMVVDAGPVVGHAIREVLENAVEHNDGPEPRVEVGLEATEGGDWARIEVTDDGPGIPQQDLAVVTGEVETEADPLQHGSGLGLWIVNWIVESFDGRVEIPTPDEDGTVVRILVPRGTEPAG